MNIMTNGYSSELFHLILLSVVICIELNRGNRVIGEQRINVALLSGVHMAMLHSAYKQYYIEHIHYQTILTMPNSKVYTVSQTYSLCECM